MIPNVVWRKSRAELMGILAEVPMYLSGAKPDPTNTIKEMYERLGRKALEIISKAFDIKSKFGTDDAGDEWEPLTEYTLERRTEKGIFYDDILYESGRLRQSLGAFDDMGRNVADRVFEILDDGVIVGTKVPYANKHHQGGKSSDLGLDVPQRRLWPKWRDWPEEWRNQLMEVIHDELGAFLTELLTLYA